jgi:CRISPR/Cas system-associated exonuclease Cas4 (RecB family)
VKIDDIIIDELTATNEKERAKHKKRSIGIFYPSEAMQCQRKLYIRVIEPERIKDKMPFGLFVMAKYAEECIIKCVRNKFGDMIKEQFYLQKEIAPGVIIHGYEDFKVINEVGNTVGIYEIKSIGSISYLIKAKEAKLTYRAQLQCYLQVEQCDNGCIVYVERGDICKIKQFDETLDEELWWNIRVHFTELRKYMDDKTIPPPIPVEISECKYCEFKKSCSAERKQLGLKASTVWGGMK